MRKKATTLLIVLAVIVFVPIVALGAFFQASFARTIGDYFDSDGVQIHYTDEGAGEPVILVHGFAVDADLNWRSPGTLDALAERYRVIAIDNRGHGLSDKPRTPAEYGEEMARDIVRLMDHLGIDRAHVIGYSMGGFITLKLAEMFPDRLLSAAPCGMGWGRMDEENTALIDRIATSLEEGKGFGPLFERLNIELDESALSGRMLNWTLSSSNDTYALAQAMRGMAQLEVAEETLRNNTVPMLTVVGSTDPLAESAGPMAEITANHDLVWIEGHDHVTCLRAPEFTQALLDFLADVDRVRDEAPLEEAA